MNVNLDELGKNLHSKLDSSIERLKSAQTHLQTFQKQTKEEIETKLSAAKVSIEDKKQEAAAAKAKIEELVQEKKSETEVAVAEWKENRDQKHLTKRAERSENYAETCIAIASYAAAEAELAILEAAGARADLDDIL